MHIDIDRFSSLKSPIHNWDPRCKIVSLMILIFCISMVKSIEIALFGSVFSYIIVHVSKIPDKYILKRITVPLLFLLPLFLFLPVSSGGRILIDLNIIRIYSNGVYLSFLIITKALSIIILFIIMLGTSTFNQTAMALKSLKLPSKLVNMLLFTYRYIFVYLEDLRKMRIALTQRGYRSRNSVKSLRSTGNLIGTLLIRSFEQTDRIYNAMILRGFTNQIPHQNEFKLLKSDILKSIFILLVAIFLVIWEVFI